MTDLTAPYDMAFLIADPSVPSQYTARKRDAMRRVSRSMLRRGVQAATIASAVAAVSTAGFLGFQHFTNQPESIVVTDSSMLNVVSCRQPYAWEVAANDVIRAMKKTIGTSEPASSDFNVCGTRAGPADRVINQPDNPFIPIGAAQFIPNRAEIEIPLDAPGNVSPSPKRRHTPRAHRAPR